MPAPDERPDEGADERLSARLAAVRARVAAAAVAAGRAPGSVRLLLATKTVAAGRIRAALLADGTDRPAGSSPVLLGENRVQELVAKAPDLADLAPTWHVIGPLQSNKVNAALRWASCVQSVASLDLAGRLAERAPDGLDVLVQVNVSGEPTKHGVPPDAAAALVRRVAALGPLRVAGLMTVGANSPDPALVAAGYRRLRELRDETADVAGTELSMGMSGDLEVAVAQGATIVRVGSAVFGARA